MRLFRSAGDGTHHWTVGQNHDPKLLITPENKDILDFRNPIHMTDWQIIPYIFPHSYSTEVDEQSDENEDDGDDDEEEEEPHHASPTGGGSSSHFAAPRLIINNIWTNSNQPYPPRHYQQDITSLTQIFPPSPPSTLGIKSVNANMRRTYGLGPETPATILLLHLHFRLFHPLRASGTMLIFKLGEG
ncbi:unnamed protein product [Lactuca saligna]|uniref:Uncharacterized protein n=1 Tax=Lactuca saligna TaxID=75948 RepID=A0AA35ZJ87_LACSI|nr:unnamed protein product [Lactuca saligna]